MNLPQFLAFCALAATAVADEKLPSFFHDVVPIFKRNCNGCHRPGKAKGQLDLTTFQALTKGGKHGVSIKPGEADESRLFHDISGDDPKMPAEGDPLTAEEVAQIQRWIAAGAQDDTPADAGLHKLSGPPVYGALPAVSRSRGRRTAVCSQWPAITRSCCTAATARRSSAAWSAIRRR